MKHAQHPSSVLSRRKLLRLSLACLPTGLFSHFAAAQAEFSRRPDVPYEPTPQAVVERMLQLADVDASDIVYDLGCGDGRIVVTAAKKYGAQGVGIDIDPQRIREAQSNAKAVGVEDSTRFQVDDLFTSDFSEATVVTLFLWPHINRKLRPQLWRQLRIGTRIVSYVWDMGKDWPPEKTEHVNGKPLYYWTIKTEQKGLPA